MSTNSSWIMRPGKRVFHGMQRVTVFLLVTSFMLTWVPSAAAAPADTLHSSFKGQFADAVFDSVDASGCIETFVFITVEEGTVKQTGHPAVDSFALSFVDVFDICNDVGLLSAEGSATLPPDAFQIDQKLNSATLTTTIELNDFISGNTFTVDYNVSWTGMGPYTTQKDHFQIKAPDFKVNSRFNGTFRDASATGTVTLGTTNLSPEPAEFAEMGSVKNGEVDIIH